MQEGRKADPAEQGELFPCSAGKPGVGLLGLSGEPAQPEFLVESRDRIGKKAGDQRRQTLAEGLEVGLFGLGKGGLEGLTEENEHPHIARNPRLLHAEGHLTAPYLFDPLLKTFARLHANPGGKGLARHAQGFDPLPPPLDLTPEPVGSRADFAAIESRTCRLALQKRGLGTGEITLRKLEPVSQIGGSLFLRLRTCYVVGQKSSLRGVSTGPGGSCLFHIGPRQMRPCTRSLDGETRVADLLFDLVLLLAKALPFGLDEMRVGLVGQRRLAKAELELGAPGGGAARHHQAEIPHVAPNGLPGGLDGAFEFLALGACGPHLDLAEAFDGDGDGVGRDLGDLRVRQGGVVDHDPRFGTRLEGEGELEGESAECPPRGTQLLEGHTELMETAAPLVDFIPGAKPLLQPFAPLFEVPLGLETALRRLLMGPCCLDAGPPGRLPLRCPGFPSLQGRTGQPRFIPGPFPLQLGLNHNGVGLIVGREGPFEASEAPGGLTRPFGLEQAGKLPALHLQPLEVGFETLPPLLECLSLLRRPAQRLLNLQETALGPGRIVAGLVLSELAVDRIEDGLGAPRAKQGPGLGLELAPQALARIRGELRLNQALHLSDQQGPPDSFGIGSRCPARCCHPEQTGKLGLGGIPFDPMPIGKGEARKRPLQKPLFETNLTLADTHFAGPPVEGERNLGGTLHRPRTKTPHLVIAATVALEKSGA